MVESKLILIYLFEFNFKNRLKIFLDGLFMDVKTKLLKKKLMVG
jgi:hypothetical protein